VSFFSPTRRPLSTWILLIGVAFTIAWLKWPSLANYLEQRHHVHMDFSVWSPAPSLPSEIPTWLAYADGTMIEAENQVWRLSNSAPPSVAVVDMAHASFQPPPSLARPAVLSPPALVEIEPTSPRESLSLKADDKVLFCGDSLMQGLAPIVAMRLKNKKIQFKDLSKQSTGLAYPHFFDWPKTIRAEIDAGNVTVLMIFLGANDAWDVYQDGSLFRFSSPGWKEVYGQRVENIIDMAEKAHVKVIWVKLPPMDDKRLANRVPILNGVIDEVGAKHPDVLLLSAGDALTDDGTTFTRYKKNKTGILELMRANDGIHLSPSGNRLLSDLVWSHIDLM